MSSPLTPPAPVSCKCLALPAHLPPHQQTDVICEHPLEETGTVFKWRHSEDLNKTIYSSVIEQTPTKPYKFQVQPRKKINNGKFSKTLSNPHDIIFKQAPFPSSKWYEIQFLKTPFNLICFFLSFILPSTK